MRKYDSQKYGSVLRFFKNPANFEIEFKFNILYTAFIKLYKMANSSDSEWEDEQVLDQGGHYVASPLVPPPPPPTPPQEALEVVVVNNNAKQSTNKKQSFNALA